MGNDRTCQEVSGRNVWNQTDTVLLVAAKFARDNTTGIIE